MKLAFSSNAFRRYTLSETISILADIGYQGIEIMCDKPHIWPEDATEEELYLIKEDLKQNDLAISNLNAFMMCAIGDFYHPSWIEKEKDLRRLRISHTIGALRVASFLGARTVSTEPGGPLEEGLRRSEALEVFKEGLLEVLTFARRKHLKILIEPEPALLIEDPEEFEKFLMDIPPDMHDSISLNFDVGHIFCIGKDPARLIRIFGKRISHFHLEDIPADRRHLHLLPGKGAIDFASVVEAIQDISYEGFLTVELYPYIENPAEAAKLAFRFFKRFFGD